MHRLQARRVQCYCKLWKVKFSIVNVFSLSGDHDEMSSLSFPLKFSRQSVSLCVSILKMVRQNKADRIEVGVVAILMIDYPRRYHVKYGRRSFQLSTSLRFLFQQSCADS